ncbi:MAG: hypothetical protein EXX96DRAFT_168712 [Benjaminiella poitrasii]|nr:MAG: hypothetical protein EXX96DRAFT_168712 [Benjaminiella poitrasii]
MTDNTISHFVVLFTAQKHKKFKTWQDGTMKYYSFNKKLVLTDEKGYNIDRKFYKGGVPEVGDELEFDGHIVTIESIESTEVVNNAQHTTPVNTTAVQQTKTPSTSAPVIMSASTPIQSPTPIIPNKQCSSNPRFKPPTMIPRKRVIKIDPEEEEAEREETEAMIVTEPMEICEAITDANKSTTIPNPTPSTPPNNGLSNLLPIQKRVRVGLSKRISSFRHRSPPTQNNTTSLSNQPSMAK